MSFANVLALSLGAHIHYGIMFQWKKAARIKICRKLSSIPKRTHLILGKVNIFYRRQNVITPCPHVLVRVQCEHNLLSESLGTQELAGVVYLSCVGNPRTNGAGPWRCSLGRNILKCGDRLTFYVSVEWHEEIAACHASGW